MINLVDLIGNSLSDLTIVIHNDFGDSKQYKLHKVIMMRCDGIFGTLISDTKSTDNDSDEIKLNIGYVCIEVFDDLIYEIYYARKHDNYRKILKNIGRRLYALMYLNLCEQLLFTEMDLYKNNCDDLLRINVSELLNVEKIDYIMNIYDSFTFLIKKYGKISFNKYIDLFVVLLSRVTYDTVMNEFKNYFKMKEFICSLSDENINVLKSNPYIYIHIDNIKKYHTKNIVAFRQKKSFQSYVDLVMNKYSMYDAITPNYNYGVICAKNNFLIIYDIENNKSLAYYYEKSDHTHFSNIDSIAHLKDSLLLMRFNSSKYMLLINFSTSTFLRINTNSDIMHNNFYNCDVVIDKFTNDLYIKIVNEEYCDFNHTIFKKIDIGKLFRDMTTMFEITIDILIDYVKDHAINIDNVNIIGIYNDNIYLMHYFVQQRYISVVKYNDMINIMSKYDPKKLLSINDVFGIVSIEWFTDNNIVKKIFEYDVKTFKVVCPGNVCNATMKNDRIMLNLLNKIIVLDDQLNTITQYRKINLFKKNETVITMTIFSPCGSMYLIATLDYNIGYDDLVQYQNDNMDDIPQSTLYVTSSFEIYCENILLSDCINVSKMSESNFYKITNSFWHDIPCDFFD
jgi:hypothetical protein